MFNRNSGCHKPFMGVSPAHYAGPKMGVGPGAKVMGTFQGTVAPGYGPMGPAPYAPTAVSPAQMGPAPYGPMGPAPYLPTAVSPVSMGPTQAFPTQVAPTQVSPTQEFVNTNVMNTVVPHVHPSHTTTVNKHVFTHQHSFPHTQSVVNECFNQQVVCGPPPILPIAAPCPPPIMPINPCCPPFGF